MRTTHLIPAALAALALGACGSDSGSRDGQAGASEDKAFDAKVRDAFLAYTRCMRAQGIDMPDPGAAGGGGIVFDARDPDVPDLESPAYKAADRKCHSHLAAVGKPAQAEQSP